MQTRFYSDELNDDFIDSKKSFSVPENYNFTPKSKIWRICAFIVYRLIMTPIAFLYCKLFLHLSIKDNTKTPIKRQKGCFIYANHTLTVGDAFIPSVLAFPKKVYVVVSPKNLAVCSTRGFLKMSGAIVIPQSLKCFKKFLGAVEKRANDNACITVYPMFGHTALL